MARSSSKKAPGSLRMTISGTATEMARIKDVAAAHKMHVTRLIHDAVADYEKNSATDSAPSDPVDSQNPKGGGTKATAKEHDDVPKQLDEIHQMLKSLSKAVKRELPRRDNLPDQPPPIYSLPSLEAVQMVCALLNNLVETGKFEIDIGQAMKESTES